MVTGIKTNGRDYHGRFAPGHPGGPGRPPSAKEREYLETLGSVCTIDDWRAICRRAVKDARAGDHRARNWLSKYLVGNPRPVPDTPVPEKPNPFNDAPTDVILEVMYENARRKEYSSNRMPN